MKTKTSLWLSICTLVLCLGVLTFGVFSALSANLNINGTLGFNMHNATVTVQGTIQNVAESTDNWVTAIPTTLNIERTIMGGETVTTTNIDLKDLYFYTGLNMIFEFTFTNISETTIRAIFPLPTVGTGVTVLTGAYNESYTNFTDGLYTTKISKDASITLIFALTMSSGTLGTNVSFAWDNITFEEVKELLDGEYFIDEENKMLSVYMGHGTSYENASDVRLLWQAFAVLGEGNEYTQPSFVTSTIPSHTPAGTNQKWYSLVGASISLENAKGHTFWFIQKYVTTNGKMFSRATSAEYYGYANETETSFIFDYIESDYLVDIGVTTGVAKEYYDSISSRIVNETYSIGSKTQIVSFESPLWLINQDELSLLNGAEVSYNNTYSEPVKTYRIGNINGDGADWWLRTPYSYGNGYIMFVDGNGKIYIDWTSYAYGIRTAFQIFIN